jgi:hypothetical protein
MKKRTWVVLAVLAGVVAWWALRKRKAAVAPPGPTAEPKGIATVGELTVADWHPPPTPPPDARFFVAL